MSWPGQLAYLAAESTIPALVGAAVTSAIARAWHGRPSFWRVLVASSVVRAVSTGAFLAAQGTLGQPLALMFGAMASMVLGPVTEVVLAQYDFDSALPKLPAVVQPSSPDGNSPATRGLSAPIFQAQF